MAPDPAVRLALVTCDPLPAESDESVLDAALAELGIDHAWVPWDAPVDWSTFEVVLLRTPWDYHRRVEEFLAWTREVAAVTELVNPADVVAWNSHKGYLLELEEAGVATVPSVVVRAGEHTRLADVADDRGWDDVVVKPAVSVGALGASRGPARSTEQQAALDDLVARGDVVVQPFLPSVAGAGETSTIFVAGEPQHAVRKVPTDGDYRSQPEHGGRLRAVPLSDERVSLGAAALAAARQVTGHEPRYARVDTIDSEDGSPRLIELELIEPDLFWSYEGEQAARRLLATVTTGR